MVRRENKNNAYAKFGGANKEYYGIFRSGLLSYAVHRLKNSGLVYGNNITWQRFRITDLNISLKIITLFQGMQTKTFATP